MWDEANEQDIRATLRVLVGRGLVDPDGSGRFSLHPVVTMQARSLLERAPDYSHTAHHLHLTHYLDLLRSADALYHGGGEARKIGLALFDTEWENIRAGQRWAASRLAEEREDAEAARLVSGYASAGWRLLSLRVSLDEQVRWLKNALEGDQILVEANVLAEAVEEDPEETRRSYRPAQARHLHLLANARREARQTDEAFALEQEACEIYRALSDRRGESTTLNGLGVLHTARGEYETAERCYLKAIELLDEEAADPEATTHPPKNRDRDRAAVLGNLTNLYRHMEKAKPAKEANSKAIAIFRAVGDMIQVGIALNNLGALRSVLEGDKPGAIKAFSTARRIFRYLGSRIDEAVSLLALGREHADAGDYRRAEGRAKEVITVGRELGNLSQEGWALVVLGDARLGLGHPDEAAKIYQEALDAACGAQDKRLETMARERLEKAAQAQENT